jgi:hypothetical protein
MKPDPASNPALPNPFRLSFQTRLPWRAAAGVLLGALLLPGCSVVDQLKTRGAPPPQQTAVLDVQGDAGTPFRVRVEDPRGPVSDQQCTVPAKLQYTGPDLDIWLVRGDTPGHIVPQVKYGDTVFPVGELAPGKTVCIRVRPGGVGATIEPAPPAQ